jgi:hypothetical protein
MQSGGKLTRKQETLISALLMAPTLVAAAQQAGVNQATVWRWLKEPPYEAAYREARRQVVQQAITQMQQASGEAVATLCRVMRDADAPASAKVGAARTVLEIAVKAATFEDLEARIMALEQQAHQR